MGGKKHRQNAIHTITFHISKSFESIITELLFLFNGAWIVVFEMKNQYFLCSSPFNTYIRLQAHSLTCTWKYIDTHTHRERERMGACLSSFSSLPLQIIPTFLFKRERERDRNKPHFTQAKTHFYAVVFLMIVKRSHLIGSNTKEENASQRVQTAKLWHTFSHTNTHTHTHSHEDEYNMDAKVVIIVDCGGALLIFITVMCA